MKRLLLFAVAWLGGLVLAGAQAPAATPGGEAAEDRVGEIRPGMKYSQYKDYYYPGFYVRQSDDPYDPLLLSLVSCYVPGLGQAAAGEWGRGLRFLGGFFLSAIARGTLATFNDGAYEEAGNLIALSGILTCYIWNICDAARVAKIKNMYYQDLRVQGSTMDWKVEPFLAAAPKSGPAAGPAAGTTPTAGLSFKISF